MTGPTRAEKVAGVRELADWLEANPNVPLPWWADVTVMVSVNNLDGMSGVSDQVRLAELVRIAGLMGVTADLRDEKAAPHPHADKVFSGGTAYRMVLVTDAYRRGYEPAAEDLPSESAAGVDTRPADEAPDAGHTDASGTSAAVPAPVGSGDGAAVTPDVWVALRRRGIHYHGFHGLGTVGQYTACGRAARPNGVQLPQAEATAFGAVPCPRCYGSEG